MKRLFKLNFEQFLEQVGKWNITSSSLNPLVREDYNDYYVFYLFTPLVDYCFAVNKKDLTPVNKMNFMAISFPAEMVIDKVKLDKPTRINKDNPNKNASTKI